MQAIHSLLYRPTKAQTTSLDYQDSLQAREGGLKQRYRMDSNHRK